METLWKVLGVVLGLICAQLCNGLPINLTTSGPDVQTQYLTGFVAVLLAICSIVLLAGCICCRRNKNGFTEFRDSPVAASVASNLDHGHSNPIANSEFTIFTPISPAHHNNNVFLANQRIVNRTPEDFKCGDIDVSSWFGKILFTEDVQNVKSISLCVLTDGSEKDFPRTRLKYIRELGKGWFGRVVEGTAQGLNQDPSEPEWTPVVVRILEASATPKGRVMFLHDVDVYRHGYHPNVLRLWGRCLDTTPLLLLQEYCTEGDLKKYLRSMKPTKETFLSTDLPLLWSYQLTQALKFLYEQKVPHPDLAARNCQLTKDLTLKLGDYGLNCSFYPADYYDTALTIPLRWCAPEIISYTNTTIQTGKITLEANIWSLGVTIWEILECGDQPYSNLTDDEVISQVLGSPNVRLPRPTVNVIYTDYMYKLMQSCWSTPESRPSATHIDLMLNDLMQVYEHTKVSSELKDSSLHDFDQRWEALKPNAVMTDETPLMQEEKKSASLTNLHGSLDNLLQDENPMDSWLENVANNTGDLVYAKGLSEAMMDLDNVLELNSSNQSPKPLHFKIGPKVTTSSESETEDENWKKKIERGAYTEKVRQKSRSVADLMVLTHVDYSESDSETLPSLTEFKNQKPKYKNMDNPAWKFGSEGNLLNVHDTFQEELRKLQDERRDSLLFVPDKYSYSDSKSAESSSSRQLDSLENSPVKKLLVELNSPAEIIPAKQVYNVFNVSVKHLNNLIDNKDDRVSLQKKTSCDSLKESKDNKDVNHIKNNGFSPEKTGISCDRTISDDNTKIPSNIDLKPKSFENLSDFHVKIEVLSDQSSPVDEEVASQSELDRPGSSDDYIKETRKLNVPKLSEIIQRNDNLKPDREDKLLLTKFTEKDLIDKDSGLNTPENSASLEKLYDDMEEILNEPSVLKKCSKCAISFEENEVYTGSFDSDKSNDLKVDLHKDLCLLKEEIKVSSGEGSGCEEDSGTGASSKETQSIDDNLSAKSLEDALDTINNDYCLRRSKIICESFLANEKSNYSPTDEYREICFDINTKNNDHFKFKEDVTKQVMHQIMSARLIPDLLTDLPDVDKNYSINKEKKIETLSEYLLKPLIHIENTSNLNSDTDLDTKTSNNLNLTKTSLILPLIKSNPSTNDKESEDSISSSKSESAESVESVAEFHSPEISQASDFKTISECSIGSQNNASQALAVDNSVPNTMLDVSSEEMKTLEEGDSSKTLGSNDSDADGNVEEFAECQIVGEMKQIQNVENKEVNEENRILDCFQPKRRDSLDILRKTKEFICQELVFYDKEEIRDSFNINKNKVNVDISNEIHIKENVCTETQLLGLQSENMANKCVEDIHSENSSETLKNVMEVPEIQTELKEEELIQLKDHQIQKETKYLELEDLHDEDSSEHLSNFVDVPEIQTSKEEELVLLKDQVQEEAESKASKIKTNINKESNSSNNSDNNDLLSESCDKEAKSECQISMINNEDTIDLNQKEEIKMTEKQGNSKSENVTLQIQNDFNNQSKMINKEENDLDNDIKSECQTSMTKDENSKYMEQNEMFKVAESLKPEHSKSENVTVTIQSELNSNLESITKITEEEGTGLDDSVHMNEPNSIVKNCDNIKDDNLEQKEYKEVKEKEINQSENLEDLKSENNVDDMLSEDQKHLVPEVEVALIEIKTENEIKIENEIKTENEIKIENEIKTENEIENQNLEPQDLNIPVNVDDNNSDSCDKKVNDLEQNIRGVEDTLNLVEKSKLDNDDLEDLNENKKFEPHVEKLDIEIKTENENLLKSENHETIEINYLDHNTDKNPVIKSFDIQHTDLEQTENLKENLEDQKLEKTELHKQSEENKHIESLRNQSDTLHELEIEEINNKTKNVPVSSEICFDVKDSIGNCDNKIESDTLSSKTSLNRNQHEIIIEDKIILNEDKSESLLETVKPSEENDDKKDFLMTVTETPNISLSKSNKTYQVNQETYKSNENISSLPKEREETINIKQVSECFNKEEKQFKQDFSINHSFEEENVIKAENNSNFKNNQPNRCAVDVEEILIEIINEVENISLLKQEIKEPDLFQQKDKLEITETSPEKSELLNVNKNGGKINDIKLIELEDISFNLTKDDKLFNKPEDERNFNQMQTILNKTKDFLNNEIQSYVESPKEELKVQFDLSDSQEEIAPSSLTHFQGFSSTPFKKRPLDSAVILGANDDYSIDFYSSLTTTVDQIEAEELKFSSNFMQEPSRDQNNDLYSLETWDNFLGKSFDEQENDLDFITFNQEPHSLLFLENNNEGFEEKLDKTNNLQVSQVINETYVPETNKQDQTFNKDTPLDKTYDANKDKQDGTFIKNDETFVKNDDTFVKNDDTFVKEEKENTEVSKPSTSTGWESGGGWFLHPQSNSEELSGQIAVQADSYVGFSMDDEIMAAIRNELLNKLPHAQRASSEQVEEREELEPAEKNEVFIRYNVYNTPLSPIPEESYVDSDDESPFYTNKRVSDESDDDSSDWSIEDNISSNIHTEINSPKPESSLISSPAKIPNHRHTPSQDSCCSNDTLFNVEDLNLAIEPDRIFETIPDEDESSKESKYSDCKGEIEETEDKTLIDDEDQKDEIPKISVHNYITDFLDNERYNQLNSCVELSEIRSENEECSSPSDKFLTVSDNTLSFGQNVAPLNSPEDRQWKDLQASFRNCEETPEHPIKTYLSPIETTDYDQQKCTNFELVTDLDDPDLDNLDCPISDEDIDKVLQEEDELIPNNEEETSGKTFAADNVSPNLDKETISSTRMEDSASILYVNTASKLEEGEGSGNVDSDRSPSDVTDYDGINKNEDSPEYVYVEKHEDNHEYENGWIADTIYANMPADRAKELDYVIAEENKKKAEENIEDLYGPLADIRFSGPGLANLQMMSTSFSESNEVGDEQDWDSGSDTRSSSSGEFIWREGEHEASLKALDAAPQSENTQDTTPMEDIQEENELSSSDSDGEGECPEFVPSAWDKYAIPTKSALRSPEKTLERKDPKDKKAVWFKKQKYHCIYEYPKEPDSPILQSYDLWKPTTDYATLADWELGSDLYAPRYDLIDSLSSTSDQERSPKNLYNLPTFSDKAPTVLDDDFFVSSSSKPFDMLGGTTSQFFPGKQFSDHWLDAATPDSAEEVPTLTRNEKIPTLKHLATIVVNKNRKSRELGGLRHTRSKLKLDLPPSPSAFSSNTTFNVEPVEEIVPRQVPTFSTFGKSRFLVQHVDTPPDVSESKNVSFEALPYKPQTQTVKERHAIESVRGEASLLDSADEDSGIDSSTLERGKKIGT